MKKSTENLLNALLVIFGGNIKLYKGLSTRELRNICQKKKEDEQFYAWYVMRNVSIYVTKLLLPTSVTPNQITIMSVAAGMAGGAFYCLGNDFGFIAGGILLQVWYLLDCVDGEIARLKKEFNDEGKYLDCISHHLVSFSAVLGFVIGLFRESGKLWVLYTGLVFLTFYHFSRMIFTSASQTIYEKNKGEKVDMNFPEGEKSFSKPYQKETKNFFARPILWALRLWPSTGSAINEVGIVVAMFITSLFDIVLFKPVMAGYFPIGSRLILIIFYSILFPVSFFVRFYFVIRRKYVTSWIKNSK